jgi:Mycothiol maleylpyruvate isomerase N-terminal domain
VSIGPLLPGGHSAARAALPAAAERIVELVRSIPDPATPMRESDWTVGEAAAHLAVVAQAFAATAAGRPVGPAGVRPTSTTSTSAWRR